MYWSIASRSSGSATAMPASRPRWAEIPVNKFMGGAVDVVVGGHGHQHRRQMEDALVPIGELQWTITAFPCKNLGAFQKTGFILTFFVWRNGHIRERGACFPGWGSFACSLLPTSLHTKGIRHRRPLSVSPRADPSMSLFVTTLTTRPLCPAAALRLGNAFRSRLGTGAG